MLFNSTIIIIIIQHLAFISSKLALVFNKLRLSVTCYSFSFSNLSYSRTFERTDDLILRSWFYFIKVNNGNIRAMYEMCVFIVNFEQILHIVNSCFHC